MTYRFSLVFLFLSLASYGQVLTYELGQSLGERDSNKNYLYLYLDRKQKSYDIVDKLNTKKYYKIINKNFNTVVVKCYKADSVWVYNIKRKLNINYNPCDIDTPYLIMFDKELNYIWDSDTDIKMYTILKKYK